MEGSTYLNFDLRIEPWEEGYRAQVIESPVDRGCCSHFTLAALESGLEMQADLDEIKSFGARLFQAVFQGEILSYLRRSQDEVERRGAEGLRIRLLLTDVPELAELPWEYLYDPASDQFLSLSTKTPIVRYLDLTHRVQPLAAKPPLRVLVMISSPTGQPKLDVEHEWAKLNQALADLQAKERVVLERLEKATLGELQARLRQGRYHVFHYIGHGGFDLETQEGTLLLEDEERQSQPVSSQVLGTLLHDEPTLRLVLLNACEGARGSRSDPFAGAAQTLVRKKIPAVIAMQTVISDEAAKVFAYEFYRALADDYPVDAALTEARKAIYRQGNEREWGTPVLFMRASDARLSGVEQPPTSPGRPKRLAVRLGPVVVPIVPVLATLLAILAAVVFLGMVYPGPAQMEGRFNVAVAEVGVMDAEGRLHRSEDGQLFAGWIVDKIERADRESEVGGVEVWHDGLPLTGKRTRLGMVSGQTPGDRAEAARELAGKIDAHVVIYGHLTSEEEPAELVLEFYVAPRVRAESAAIIGRYQLGDPIAVPANFDRSDPLAVEALASRVEARAGLLFWLLLGLRDDLLGRPSDALAVLRQAETELTALREQGDGKELLYYFKGRAALFLDFYDEAQEALERALQSNPAFARAQIALGSIYFDRAQFEPAGERLVGENNVEQAIDGYRKGLELAKEANEPLTEVIGHLALGQAYRLRGETHFLLQEDAEAERFLELAVQELRLVLEPLAGAEQYRLLAQAYQSLGLAYHQQGEIWQLRGNVAESRERLQAARSAYAGCIEQGGQAPEDEILQTTIIADSCQPNDKDAQETLRALEGG